MSKYIMYLRKSRTDHGYAEESVELTLSRHRERLEEFCRQRGIVCDLVLQEVSSADSITGRPEMIRLLQLVESGAYEGVVCIDMDRLSRGSGADQALVINTFKYSDTKIITPSKTYDFALETDEQFAELSLFMAKQEYRQIKKRLYQGRVDSTMEGKWQSAKAPYGYETYKLKGQKGFSLRILPEEAEVVRLIFRLYLSGEDLGCGAVARKLNELGFRSRVGGPWFIRAVHNVLSNPVYTGKVRFSRYKYCTVVENGEISHKTRINKSPLIAQGLHEAIISEEDFRQAQQLLTDRRKTCRHFDQGLMNPLTNIVRCRYCGGRYSLKNARRDGTQMIGCLTKGCRAHSARVDLVEDRILEALHHELDLVFSGAEAGPAGLDLDKTVESLLKKEDALKAKLERQTDAYENGVYDLDVFVERSDRTRAELAAVREEVEALKRQISQREELAPRIRDLIETYKDLGSAEEKNQLLKELIAKVEIRKETAGSRHDDDFELTIFPRIL